RRRRTSREQHKTLEDTFQANRKPNSKVRHALADQLCMPVRSVQVWFQNRRAKAK
ncbi:homeobox domain-containing protein, partial [Phycomyces blakesleeanus]